MMRDFASDTRLLKCCMYSNVIAVLGWLQCRTHQCNLWDVGAVNMLTSLLGWFGELKPCLSQDKAKNMQL